ncbi:MAG: hypothetical protein JO156_12385 [Solirubrobacterales bacterium]|nr:hypothetical protein [Solirubrobacterales bacterium]
MLLLADAEPALFLSGNRVEGLIRLGRRRRLQRSTGSTRAANAASRWGGPDLTTPIRAVPKSGPDELPGREGSLKTGNQILVIPRDAVGIADSDNLKRADG